MSNLHRQQFTVQYPQPTLTADNCTISANYTEKSCL